MGCFSLHYRISLVQLHLEKHISVHAQMLSLYYRLVDTLVSGITVCIFIYQTAYIANNCNVRVIVNALPMCINNMLRVKLILFCELAEGTGAVLSQ